MNRQSSFSRQLSMNPTRLSVADREVEVQSRKSKICTNSERSSLRPPTKISKSVGGYQLATPMTLVTPQPKSYKFHADLPTGSRSKSPSAERFSSLGAKSSKKDTRQLNDKDYQNQMLQRIDKFFYSNNQISLINQNGSLKPITLKMFVSVTDFLLDIMGLKLDLDIHNYTEKLPVIAKKLHYPGVVTKSWLKTANAMHSWPQVLGWICWLVEVCETDIINNEQIQLETIPFRDDSDGEVINRNKFLNMFDCYKAWNDNNDELEKECISRYLKQVAEDCGFTDDDNQKAQLELDDSTDKLNRLKNQKEDVLKKYNELLDQQNLHLHEIDMNKRDTLTCDESLKQIENDMAKLEKLINQFDAKTEEIIAENVELESCVKSQTMNVAERDQIIKESCDLKKSIRQFDQHLEELKNEFFLLDIKHSKLTDNLRKIILDFNKNLIVNYTGKDCDDLKLPENHMADFNLIDYIKEKGKLFSKMNNDLQQQLDNLKSSIESKKQKLDKLKEDKQTLIQEQNELEKNFYEEKLSIKNLKVQEKNEYTKLKDQIQNLKNDINSLESNLSIKQSEINNLEAIIKERDEKYDALKRQQKFLEESAEKFFKQLHETDARYYQQFHGKVQKYKKLLI